MACTDRLCGLEWNGLVAINRREPRTAQSKRAYPKAIITNPQAMLVEEFDANLLWVEPNINFTRLLRGGTSAKTSL